MMNHLTEIIIATIAIISPIVTGWFAYNQRTKDKLTDLKIEQWKQQEKRTNFQAIEHIAKIYGLLWEMLYELRCDRVYILQPHPLSESQFVSITLEVKRKGMSPMKREIDHLPMCEIARFVKELASECWIYYPNIDQEEIDKKMRAIMDLNGTEQVAIKKLINHRGEWIGSLFMESSGNALFEPERAKRGIYETANSIQYILPEYKQEKWQTTNN